jgi:N-acetyl-gamma-glutamyl-phosphate reductase
VGAELYRLLLGHPGVARLLTSSVTFTGQTMADVYPNLHNATVTKHDGALLAAEDVAADADLVFTALPHGLAEAIAAKCLAEGKKLIDLSADFRFSDEATFREWYKKGWAYPALHQQAVYGLPEMYRPQLTGASLVGNPGCYVTAATLALLPALTAGIIETDAIIVDAGSGITGAGRSESLTYNFCEAGEAASVYGVGTHRHLPEMERNCSVAAGRPVRMVFTPHLLPMSRGIIATCYAPLTPTHATTLESLRTLYADHYAAEPFVRLLPSGVAPSTRIVRLSNYCDLQVYLVQGGNMLQVVSVLDNMVKGAAGQAVQNMNLLCGFEETAGLDAVPAAF